MAVHARHILAPKAQCPGLWVGPASHITALIVLAVAIEAAVVGEEEGGRGENGSL